MSGEDKYKIFIRDLSNEKFCLEVTKTMTIEQVIDKIKKKDII